MKKFSIVILLVLGLTILLSSSVSAGTPSEAYGNYSVYWGELHWHSSLSDAVETCNYGYTWARDNANLDFTSGTEHLDHTGGMGGAMTLAEWINTYQPTTNSFNNPTSFVTLLGQEWSVGIEPPTVHVGHHNIYFKDGVGYYACDPDSTLTIQGLITCLENQGYSEGEILIAPHHIATSDILDTHNWDVDDYMENDWVRNVEIYSKWGCGEYYGCPKTFNAPSTDETHYALYALNTGHIFSFIGGTDSHATKPGTYLDEKYLAIHLYNPEPGLTGVFIDDTFNRANLFDAIYDRHTYATDGKEIELYFDINGELMGEEFVTSSVNKSINIVAYAHAGALIDDIVIVKGVYNATTSTYDATSSGFYTIDVDASSVNTTYVDTDTNDSIFYYVRLTTNDNYRAWGSPIWITYNGTPPTPTPTPTPSPTPTITPTPTPTTVEEGSDTMLLGFIILPLSLLGIGLARREIWLQLASGIAWFGLGMYIFITFDATVGEPVWIMALISVMIALAIFTGMLVNKNRSNRSEEIQN